MHGGGQCERAYGGPMTRLCCDGGKGQVGGGRGPGQGHDGDT